MKFETIATHGFIDLKKQNNCVSLRGVRYLYAPLFFETAKE